MNRVMAAAVVSVMALIALAGCSDDEAPADWVETTPHALAAIAIEHTDIEPTMVEGSIEDDVIGASIEFDNSQRLSVSATKGGDDTGDPCEDNDDRGTCKVISADAGDVELYWEDEEPEEDPGIVNVAFVTDDGVNVAHYAGDAITGDPRELDLGVDVDEMVAIVTDDRFGLTTSKDLTETEISGYTEAPAEARELSAEVIASKLTTVNPGADETAAYEVDASEYGPGSIGATVEFGDGVTVTGYYVPDAERAEGCPQGWDCQRSEGKHATVLRREKVLDPGDPWQGKARSIEAWCTWLDTEEEYAGIVVWHGPELEYGHQYSHMELNASLMGDPGTEDEGDITELDGIWQDR